MYSDNKCINACNKITSLRLFLSNTSISLDSSLGGILFPRSFSYYSLIKQFYRKEYTVGPIIFRNILIRLKECSKNHQTFTCSKSAIETLKKVGNTFKVNNKDRHQRKVNDAF